MTSAAEGPTRTSPLAEPDAARQRALRQMKVVAGGMLAVAAVIYLLCHFVAHGRGVWGYVEAAAEASMVGGLADWFAVTALFRHPFGLPIPHTAIIARKKDQIGEGLAGFVQQNFLTPQIVGERVAAARVPQRTGEWLSDPEHARKVADELAGAVAGLANVLRDDVLRNAVGTFADKRLRELEVAPLLSRLIEALCESGQHQVALTSAAPGPDAVPGCQPFDVPPAAGRRVAGMGARVGRRTGVRPGVHGSAVVPG